ncbi:S1/P1 nuclease [Geojedonia litorea]|uniref:S1/P1 nuclease n=1 Tax=Geojedonia litorea TaxID=1268269 RepID=A0ABV9N515_9FLAO
MNLKVVFTLIVTLFLLYPLNAGSRWGKTGHRTVGAIADQYLTNNTKRELKKLLNHESLALVSTYADEIKSDRQYSKFYTWHYINMPLDSEYDTTNQHPEGDLVSGIEFCKTVIKDKNASKEDRAFYLRMLIHLIGDLHQPMHIGLEEDRGGNDFKVQWQFRDTNLHSVWDSKMIDDYGMSYSELAHNADYLSKAQIKAIQEGSVIDWVNETHVLTREVYNSVESGENLRNEYSYRYLNIARKQIQLAGIRLAKTLNELF